MKAVTIQPDTVSIIANRLAQRLVREQLLGNPDNGTRKNRADYRAAVEALANELHLDILERMTKGGLIG